MLAFVNQWILSFGIGWGKITSLLRFCLECWEENIALKKKLRLFHSLFHCLSTFQTLKMISMLGKWLSYESAHTGSYFFLKGALGENSNPLHQMESWSWGDLEYFHVESAHPITCRPQDWPQKNEELHITAVLEPPWDAALAAWAYLGKRICLRPCHQHGLWSQNTVSSHWHRLLTQTSKHTANL